MSAERHPYRKYQVYFFLYLAVICELLIVIVERDDAEAELIREQLNLKEKNALIIKELLKNNPTVEASSNNSLEVGESRRFTVGVKGLGDADNVTVPPVVYIFNGEDVDVSDTSVATARIYPEALPTEGLYEFEWTGKASGFYTFSAKAGTDRVSFVGEDQIKIGSLAFDPFELDEVIKNDPELLTILREEGMDVEEVLRTGKSLAEGFINRSRNLDPASFTLEVFSNPPTDQLFVTSKNLVTATGFNTTSHLSVEGSTPDRVKLVEVSKGNTTKDSTWNWNGKFATAGEYKVNINAKDNRVGGKLSISNTSFSVTVKDPIMRGYARNPYIGEKFERDFKVDGLEDNSKYSWVVSKAGEKVAAGSGSVVKYDVPLDAVGSELIAKVLYANKIFPIILDSERFTSEFKFVVRAPFIRLKNASFTTNGEYSITNVFTFTVYKCGRCLLINRKPIETIRVEVEDEDWGDLLDYYEALPFLNPSTGEVIGQNVTFYLRGRIPKDGIGATITIKVDSKTEKIPVYIVPEGYYN